MALPSSSPPPASALSSSAAPRRLAWRTALSTLTLVTLVGSSMLPGCGGQDSEPSRGSGGSAANTGGANSASGGGDAGTPGSIAEGLGDVTPSDTPEGEPAVCSPGLAAASTVAGEDSITEPAPSISEFIVVDQFGYLPASEKIAVVRDPETEVGGAASPDDFTPGATYRLINAEGGETVLEGAAVAWNGGAEHAQSGDRAWHFDFSSVTAPGIYYVLDVQNGVRSDVFRIASDVYRETMKQAVRTFFYQRAGYPKEAPHAEADWVDGASHVGPGQDTEARRFDATSDASTERDVSGGWYDAGDYNKYTPWTSDYVIEMLRAYVERPEAFGDDYELPDSGNCLADLLDEAVFGLEHLVKLQLEDGSVISVMELDGASPPSAASGATVYGPPSTNATLRAATAYAWGARVLAEIYPSFAAALLGRAVDAYAWADANPDVTFSNQAAGVAAGEQQSSASHVAIYKLGAALALYRLTGDASYKDFFEANYAVEDYNAFRFGWLGAYQLAFTDLFLDYTTLEDADPTIVSAIRTPIVGALSAANNLGNLEVEADPYMAYHDDMTWGSNSIRCRSGIQQYGFITYGLDEAKEADAARAAGRYVHYIHGVNPLGLVYLSAMERFGAHESVGTFYHTWFHDGSAWDENPAPGFLVGGPNASYDWDGCCNTNSCGGTTVVDGQTVSNNEICQSRPSPDRTQSEGEPEPSHKPAMKAYWPINDTWPLNSWSITENSNGYQLAYIRLLSKFVN